MHIKHIAMRALLSAEHSFHFFSISCFSVGIVGKMDKWCSMNTKRNGWRKTFIRPLFGTIYSVFGFQWDVRNKNNSWNQIILRIWSTCGMQLNKKARAAATTTAIPPAAVAEAKAAAAMATAVAHRCRTIGLLTQSALWSTREAKKHQAFRAVPIFVRIHFLLLKTHFSCAYTQSYTLMHSRVLCVLCIEWVLSSVVWFWSHSWRVYCVCVVTKGRKQKRKTQNLWVCVSVFVWFVPWKTDTKCYI